MLLKNCNDGKNNLFHQTKNNSNNVKGDLAWLVKYC